MIETLKRPAIGSKIRVTIRNPFKKIMMVWSPDHYSYEGTVVPSDGWMPDTAFNLSGGPKSHPIREVALQNVLKIEPLDLKKEVSFEDVKASKSKTFQILSSKKDKTYTVSVEDGRWTCNCTAGMYRKKTKCRHIEEAQKLDV